MEVESATREGFRKRGRGFTVAEGVGRADGSLDADLGGDGGHCQRGWIDGEGRKPWRRRASWARDEAREERAESDSNDERLGWEISMQANKEFGCGVPADLFG
ncbi:hypothetical protein BHE74_00013734 [Ensete ventricosum]|nr:hypothetical protein BHE74_00013734 [Ensete ventricosum]